MLTSSAVHFPDSHDEVEPIILEPSVQAYFSRCTAHNRLLADTIRLDAFRRAIFALVKPGDVVIDIGAGTGKLSEYAIQAGARAVCLIEENAAILDIARRRLVKYAQAARLLFIAKHSTQVRKGTLRKQADIIISETIGTLGFNEGIVDTLADARRFLRPGGRFIPQSLDILCGSACISDLPPGTKNGFICREPSVKSLPPRLTSSPLRLVSLGCGYENKIMRGEKTIRTQDSLSNALIIWFSAALSKGNSLSNWPLSRSSSWGIAVLPINQVLPPHSDWVLTWNVRAGQKHLPSFTKLVTNSNHDYPLFASWSICQPLNHFDEISLHVSLCPAMCDPRVSPSPVSRSEMAETLIRTRSLLEELPCFG